MTSKEPFSKDRKTTKIRLSTGNQIELTVQEERMLKIAYDYLAGFAKRSQKEITIDKKKEEVTSLYNSLPTTARVLIRDRAVPLKKGAGELSLISGQDNMMSDHERKLEEYLSARGDLHVLEEDLKKFLMIDHKISIRDLDGAIKKFGAHLSKKELEQMIWEIDENSDAVIDYEEFQLTYYRNIMDATGNEPCAFFHILEFITFDEQHKGYMIEDDCMEILFARHGSAKLEEEMQWLFGSNLRALGGDGTLSLSSFLDSCLRRVGRRALISNNV